MKENDVSPEEAMKQIQKIFKKRGTKALEIARKEVLQEKIESPQARAALRYFMTEYWHDLARPSLLSMACEAVGGDPEMTTELAIPMTLISGALDIHDDIIDQSKTKNGRPTVYGRYGRDIALLVGDGLLFKGFALLNQLSQKASGKTRAVNRIIKEMFYELGDAEALELRFMRRLDISAAEYVELIKKKAADVEAHTRIGGIIGGGSRAEIEALGSYGRLLGTMIILRDDWIDTLDLEEAKHRIKRECLPLPIIYALQNPRTKQELRSLLSNPKTRNDFERILEITKKTDAFKLVQNLMERLAKSSLESLRNIKHNKAYLELLIRAVVPAHCSRSV